MDSTLPVAIPYKNQRGWLIAFGIIEILISCGFVLITLFSTYVLVGPARAKIPPGPIPPLGAAVFMGLEYELLAVLFFTGGIGSILCKNWARILMLVVSGLWLGLGLMSMLTLTFIVPAMTHQHPGNILHHGKLVVMIALIIVMMVLLPAACLFFYSRKSVRSTCLAPKGALLVTPVTGETPTPGLPPAVAILGVWQAVAAFIMFVCMFIFPMTVVFGVVLHGAAAVLVMLTYSVLFAYTAWMVFRQKLLGWRIAILTTGLGMISALVTILRPPDMLQLYRQMGFDQKMLHFYEQVPQFWPVMWWGMMVMGTVLVFVLYTRKFFPKKG
jgi:hypothetical protein